MMAKTFVDVLRERARRQPDRRIFTFLSGGESEGPSLTYGELDRRARAIAARLQGARGERALLLYPPGLEFIEAFFGCLYAGVIAVPAYPPTPPLERSMPRLLAIVHDARPRFILTTAGLCAAAAALAPADSALAAAEWVATDEIESTQADAWDEPGLVGSSVAFLQYTSGSTRTPRGVVVTHGNLLENSALIQRALGVSESTRSVSWLPLYHDMGLIGGVVQPVYAGCFMALMSPLDFLQRPVRWLQAIARYQATISGGPNFGYELCVRKTTPEERAALDLRSWELAFDGAEPVRPDTLARFAAAFEPSGFRAQAFFPCYGLAEATLFVSGGHMDGTVDPAAKIASCGRVAAHTSVAIVDPERWVPLAAGEVGEIWISGPSVAAGYWANPGESLGTFGATLASGEGRFLRTGDLGFLRDGQLFVTGRLKDLIIIRGRNHYPQDIERTVEDSHPAIRRGCCAAFAAQIEGEERLVVVAEIERRFAIDRRRANVAPASLDRRAGDRRQLETMPPPDPRTDGPLDPSAIVATVRQQVLAQHGVRAESVILLPAGQIPKTSSGKIQRSACRTAYSERTLEAIAA